MQLIDPLHSQADVRVRHKTVKLTPYNHTDSTGVHGRLGDHASQIDVTVRTIPLEPHPHPVPVEASVRTRRATCRFTLAVFPDTCYARIPCAQNHRIATGLRERRAPWVCGCTTATAGGLDSDPWADGRYSKLWSESAAESAYAHSQSSGHDACQVNSQHMYCRAT